MIRSAFVFSTILAGGGFLNGCASHDTHTAMIESDEVMLGLLGPVAFEADPTADDAPATPANQLVFQFGAGDSLGRSLFSTYVVAMRAQKQRGNDAQLANVTDE